MRVLQLLKDNFGPGDKVVDLDGTLFTASPFVYTLPVITKDGKKRVLLVNKRDRPFQVTIPGITGAQISVVDQQTGFGPPGNSTVSGETLTLGGFAVAAVTLK
jgi:hypothetical protein